MQTEWFRKLVETAPYGAKGKIARAMGINGDKLSRILSGKRRITFEEVNRAAQYFGVPLPGVPGTNLHPASIAKIGGKFAVSSERIPVFGQVVGGIDGDFVMDGVSIDEVRAPPPLVGISNAYAVIVSGDSMEPRYFAGESLYVDPTRRFKKGDFVIAQIRNPSGDGAPLAYVKRFVRWDSRWLILEQYNPAKETEFGSDEVVSVHVIVMGGI